MSREEREFREGAVRLVARKTNTDTKVRRMTTAQRARQERFLSQIQREEVRWVT